MTTFTEASSIIKNYKTSENSFLPRQVCIPLSQENNVVCKALVKPGDIVQEGDVIASLDDTSFIHSSVPGTVIEIKSGISPNGNINHHVVIQTSGKFSYLGKAIPEKDFIGSDVNSIPEILQRHGVINTFDISKPVNFGLEIKNNVKASYLVVRLFDEDNFRFTDSLISKFYIDQIIKTSQIVAASFNAKGVIFAINALASNRKLIHALQQKKNKKVEVQYPIPFFIVDMNIKRYPSGTRREILSAYNRNYKRSMGFSVTKHEIFTDASTIYEAYKALYLDMPCVSKPVFINGNCLKVSGLLNVRLGMSIKELVSQLGGFVKKPGLILINGTIVGNSVPDTDIPITKYVKSISIVSKNKETDKHIYSCVNCGSCRNICPPKLAPDLLYNNATNFRTLPEVIQNTALACTNCGLCNIVCPSRLPLCQTITVLKDKTMEERLSRPVENLDINKDK